MNLIDANCPSCRHPLTVRIDSLDPGKHTKTYLCEKCMDYISFEYKLGMDRGKRLYVQGDWLKSHYSDQGMTMQEIADICGCTAMTIRDWLIRHGIPTRARGERGVK